MPRSRPATSIPNNLFVTGGSGGGVLTAWIVGKTDRFRAAATQKPVINWASLGLTADIASFSSPYWFAKQPWEDPMGYWERSPLSLVGNVKTPTLVVVGSEDYRTPDSEAEQYLRGAAAARRSDRVREGPGREPRRHHRPAKPGGGQGERDPRLVRSLSHDRAAQPVASNEGASPPAAH